MLISLAIVFILGIIVSWLFRKISLPPLLGMLLVGIAIGPGVLNILDNSLLAISGDLRQIALLIILTRAGLSFDWDGLKKAGISAILMCFVPACFEIAAAVLLAPLMLGMSVPSSFVLGTVLAAVSPAVVVPRMLRLAEEGYGVKQCIPQMIMAGASADDIFVIVLFTVAVNHAQGNGFAVVQLLTIPVTIVTGVAIGVLIGRLLTGLSKRISLHPILATLLLLSVSFVLVAVEEAPFIPLSGFLAVISLAAYIQRHRPKQAQRLENTYEKLWIGAEILLFVLVGAAIRPSYVLSTGPAAVLLVFGCLLVRMLGVWVCLLPTTLSLKEKLFCMIAYTPKATVQAAIGTLPLSMGLPGGEIIATVAVLSILITAPIGAIGMDMLHDTWLKR